MKITLQPQTKLFLILFVFIASIVNLPLAMEVILVVYLLGLYYISDAKRWFWRLLMIYGLQLFVYLVIMPGVNHLFFIYMLSFLADGTRRMMPSILIGVYTLMTTRSEEWVAWCKHWHLPKGLTVVIAVIGRFYPTIKVDYQMIRQSLKMRGILANRWSLLRHPIQAFERLLVPILINSYRVAQDLTIAALTTGLGLTTRQTSLVDVCMTTQDFLALGCSLLIVGTIIGVSI